MDPRDLLDVLCLREVPRDPIQNEEVALREALLFKKKRDDLLREREMFVLEQEAAFKNAVDEVELFRGIGG